MEHHKKSDHHQHHHQGHHEVPLFVYSRVWMALIVFTVVTVLTSTVDFGGHWNILIAMAIASVKAALVMLFFMGLRYDGYENNVAFLSAFGFLGIFVALTGADLFYRESVSPVRVQAQVSTAGSGGAVDVAKFAAPTPELTQKGQQLFGQQCAMCHGAAGKGDGPAAAALNPKPRNFTEAANWKNPRSVAGIFKSITEGLPGTPMPPFAGISAEDRFALVHYIRSVGPAVAADAAKDKADLDALQAKLGAGGGPAKPQLSIDRAMEILVREHGAAQRL